VPAVEEAGRIRMGTVAGRWVVAAAVLGSGVAFLDSTVVNVALPAIGKDLGTGLSGLQWVVDGYLLTLSALLLLGGSLGDLYGRRRIYVIGLVAFTGSSALCGLAPSVGFLTVARAIQGVGGALLVPGSLSIISASFVPDDRGQAVGAWSGLAGVATAIGPFVGGWLVDAVSWRLVFLINVPLAAAAVLVAVRHVPESSDPDAVHRPDVVGAALATVGLGGVVYALIQGAAERRVTPAVGIAGALGALALIAFPFAENRSSHPLVPLSIFRSRQFDAANLTTLAVYAALGGALFFLVVELQSQLGYSALEAGSALLPVTIILLLLSARTGRLAQRTGPRLPMTVGPVVAGLGLLLAGEVGPGDHYLTKVLPAVVVLGIGMAFTVAPLTAAVMGAVDEHHVGVASGLNNAVARMGGLLAVALLPAVSGLGGVDPSAAAFHPGVVRALRISAVVAIAGGLISLAFVRRARAVKVVIHPAILHACADPAVCEPEEAAEGAA
jgi:EmrB/QacA subfamily drug resistance transporter